MTQDPRAVAKAVMDSIDKTFGDYYKEVGKIEKALTDARRQAWIEAADECSQRAYAIGRNEPLHTNHMQHFLDWLRAQASQEAL